MKLALDTKLGQKIIALAAPVVTAMISQTLINQADHILVGRLPAEESVAGQAALQGSLMLLWFFGGALSAVGVGTQALTARRLGEGADHEAGRVLSGSLVLSLATGTFFSILCWILSPHLLPLLSKSPRVIELGVPYLRWRYIGLFAMVVTMSYKSFFDGLGKTWVHMAAAIGMNVVNFVLALGLIFGRFGLPRLGVPGAGIASTISSALGLLFMFVFSLRADLRKRFKYYEPGTLKSSVTREIYALSWPSGVASCFALFGFMLFYAIVGRSDQALGHTQPIFQSATANLINIFQLVFISCIAYGTATATLVGQNMGAKDFDLAERFVYEAAKIGFLVFAALGVLTMIFPDAILHVWCKDQSVIDAARPILRLLGGFEPVACLALVFTYALYGAGNPRYVMIVELLAQFAVLVPLAYLLVLVFNLGVWGGWIAMLIYVLVMASAMAVKFATGSWKSIQI